MNAKTQLGRAICALLVAGSISGCDFISPTELNPNAVPEATVDQLFTAIQVNTFFLSEGMTSRVAAIWTQQMAGTDRQFAIIDTYVHNEQTANNAFNAAFTGGGLIDLRQAITQAEEAGRRPYAGILKIHEAYMMGLLASIWGDVPYSEAARAEYETPALDSQADVYAALQGMLDEAIADLAAGGSGPSGADLNFGGNTANWTAVAHTLKARLYMHWAEVNGSSAYSAALSEAGSGIQSAAGSWKAIHSNAATESNLWYQFMRDRSGYISAGDYLVPTMVADNDPRLPLYFSQASGGGYASRDSELSADGYGSASFDFPILTCAENAFIMAEANYQLGNEAAARTAAQAALACEEAEWSIDLSAQKNAFDGLSGAALLEGIMGQKYVALFLNTEVWNDWKRTCLPAITQRAGGMPGRLYYSQAERQTNPNIPEVGQQPLRNANDPNPCS